MPHPLTHPLTHLMLDKCLPLVVQRLHEALDSYDTVHQIKQTIILSASVPFACAQYELTCISIERKLMSF